MKNNKTKKEITPDERKRETIKQISWQVELALASENVKDGVKDCLMTIIGEMSSEADMRITDFSLVRAALPNVFDSMEERYALGWFHAIHSIIRFDTDAFQKFYDEGLHQDIEDLANLLSQVMKHPKMPTNLYNLLSDELIETSADTDSPEWILGNLKKWSV